MTLLSLFVGKVYLLAFADEIIYFVSEKELRRGGSRRTRWGFFFFGVIEDPSYSGDWDEKGFEGLRTRWFSKLVAVESDREVCESMKGEIRPKGTFYSKFLKDGILII